MIFVDTSAWFAITVPSDANHRAASLWIAQNTQTLLTTDYVIDEALTLLRTRREAQRAISLGSGSFPMHLQVSVSKLTHPQTPDQRRAHFDSIARSPFLVAQFEDTKRRAIAHWTTPTTTLD